MKQFIKQLAIGFSRQIWRFFASAFIAYSVIWTVLESLSLLFPTLKPEGWIYFLAMIVAGLVWGTYRVFPRQRIHLRFKAIDTTIEVEFGDLFQSQGLKVIPVNEFFDSDLGDHVSPRSLHGQLINRFFGSYPAAFDALVEKELKDKPHDSLNRAALLGRYGALLGRCGALLGRHRRWLSRRDGRTPAEPQLRAGLRTSGAS